MSETKHNPTPWSTKNGFIYDADGKGIGYMYQGMPTAGRREKNADVAVSRTNALAGLNPEAVGEAVKFLEDFLRWECTGGYDAHQSFKLREDAPAILSRLKATP